MRQNRSTDPWSSFLEPSERAVGSAVRRLTEEGHPVPAPGGGDLPEPCRRVLDALAGAPGPLSVEALHDRLGLTLLEIADAVRTLEDRGLVAVRREGDDDLVVPAPGRDA